MTQARIKPDEAVDPVSRADLCTQRIVRAGAILVRADERVDPAIEAEVRPDAMRDVEARKLQKRTGNARRGGHIHRGL